MVATDVDHERWMNDGELYMLYANAATEALRVTFTSYGLYIEQHKIICTAHKLPYCYEQSSTTFEVLKSK